MIPNTDPVPLERIEKERFLPSNDLFNAVSEAYQKAIPENANPVYRDRKSRPGRTWTRPARKSATSRPASGAPKACPPKWRPASTPSTRKSTGKGFAVVADDVRNLAQRSAQAARDTSTLIENTVARVKNGSDIATKLDSDFREIDSGARETGKLAAEISSATNEQAQGVDQVNTAVAQMDKVTQANAASAEECASASERLSAQSRTLKDMVDGLVALVMGDGGDSRRGSAPSGPAARKAAPRPAPASRGVSPSTAKRRLPAPSGSANNVMRPSEVIPLDGDSDFGDF